MAEKLTLQAKLGNQLSEMPLVEIAFEVLISANEPFYYRDLMAQVAELRHMTQADIDEMIARLYTDINIDGRFLCIGDNVWGLKRWYPVERAGDKSSGKRFFRKDVLDFDDDDDGILPEEEELLEDDSEFEFVDEEVETEAEPLLEDDLELLDEEEVESEEELDLEEEEEEDEEF